MKERVLIGRDTAYEAGEALFAAHECMEQIFFLADAAVTLLDKQEMLTARHLLQNILWLADGTSRLPGSFDLKGLSYCLTPDEEEEPCAN